MGVKELMPFVGNATNVTTLAETGAPKSTVAVDISHWMYRAAYSCPEAIYHRTNVNVIYERIINFIDNYVKLLKFYDIELYFVFDGLRLPAKQITHQERAAKKAEARKLVEKFLAAKNSQEARKQMIRCTEIKFDVTQQVITYCKRENIQYIVAPYEADAQLAFLNLNDICEYVITEDTDLILYGCKKIIYKLDNEGNCVLYDRSLLGKSLGTPREELSFEKFRRICIMSGCDYLKNIPNVGLKSAQKFFMMTKQDNVRILLPKLATYLKSARLAGKVTEEYIEGFIQAESTFKHHIVYDPINEKLRPLEPYPKGKSSSDFPMAGKRFHRSLAKEIVAGNIDLDSIDPDLDLEDASDASDVDHDTDCEEQ